MSADARGDVRSVSHSLRYWMISGSKPVGVMVRLMRSPGDATHVVTTRTTSWRFLVTLPAAVAGSTSDLEDRPMER
jgi:hypothetical protein